MESEEHSRADLRILERLTIDHARGALRSLVHYQQAFAAWPSLVASNYAAFAPHSDRVPVSAQAFAGYEILRELGRGGQGTVYLARDLQVDQWVALKILPASVLTTSTSPAVLARELEAFERLDDVGLAGVLGHGVHEGRAWIAMRYVEGEPLDRLLEDWRRGDRCPSVIARVGMLTELARALASAHRRGVVHRDIKPSNAVVQATGKPVLIDFGLARAIDSALPSHTRTGDVLGTPQYLSPERLQGHGRDDARTDVWSLGILLYEMLTLAPPFHGVSVAALARSIERDELPRLKHAMQGVCPAPLRNDLDAILCTALEKDPRRRYASAGAMHEDLTRALAGDRPAARLPSTLMRGKRWVNRNRMASALMVVLIAAVIATAIVAVAFERAADAERRAQWKSLAHLAIADAEQARLALESNQLARTDRALQSIRAANVALRRLASQVGDVQVDNLPDRRLLRDSAAKALCTWDLVHEATLDAGGFGSVFVAPDASGMAFVGVTLASQRSEMKWIDLHTLSSAVLPDALLTPRSSIAAAAPRGSALVFVGEAGFSVVEMTSGLRVDREWTQAIERRGDTSGRAGRRGFAAHFSPDGTKIALACEDELGGTWSLWQRAGQLVRRGTWDGNGPAWCHFSRDGATLAVPGGEKRKPRVDLVPVDGDGDPNSLTISADFRPEERVLAGLPLDSQHAAVVVLRSGIAALEWLGEDLRHRTPQRLPVDATGVAAQLSISPDERLLALAIGGQLALVDLVDHVTSQTVMRGGAVIELLQFEPSGTLLHYRRSGRMQRLRTQRRLTLLEPLSTGLESPVEVVVERRAAARETQDRLALPRAAFVNTATNRVLPLQTEGVAFGVEAMSSALNGPYRAARLVWFGDNCTRTALVVFDCEDDQVLFEYEIESGLRGGGICVDDSGALLADIDAQGNLSLYACRESRLLLSMATETRPLRIEFDAAGNLRIAEAQGTRRIHLQRLHSELKQLDLDW